jgi:hypothetical protein
MVGLTALSKAIVETIHIVIFRLLFCVCVCLIFVPFLQAWLHEHLQGSPSSDECIDATIV